MSGIFLRQATASQSRALGPFVDDTDFKTPKTALTIANTDIKIVSNGGASANKNSGGGTHRVNGVYGVTFDATDTATVGELEVSVVVAGALPVFHTFNVLEEATYDITFASAATGAVPVASIAANAIDANAIASSAITAAKIGAGAIVESKIGTAAIDNTKFANGAITAGAIAADAITAAKLAADVTTELQTGLATAAALATVDGTVNAILTDTAEIGTAGAGLTAINLPDQAMNLTGNITGNLSGSVGSVTGAVGSVTGTVGGLTSAERNAIADAAFARSLGAEAVSADGAVPTLAQAIFEALSLLGEFSIAGTTITCRRRDGTTLLFTSTLDDAATPTSRTRAT